MDTEGFGVFLVLSGNYGIPSWYTFTTLLFTAADDWLTTMNSISSDVVLYRATVSFQCAFMAFQ